MSDIHPNELATSIDGMTTEMHGLRVALNQRVRALRLNLVVIAIAVLVFLATLITTAVQYKLAHDETTLRNQRAVCVNTINANYQVRLGAIVVAFPASRAAEGKPPLTKEEQAGVLADFARATELTRRTPEICYGDGEPDETPLDR